MAYDDNEDLIRAVEQLTRGINDTSKLTTTQTAVLTKLVQSLEAQARYNDRMERQKREANKRNEEAQDDNTDSINENILARKKDTKSTSKNSKALSKVLGSVVKGGKIVAKGFEVLSSSYDHLERTVRSYDATQEQGVQSAEGFIGFAKTAYSTRLSFAQLNAITANYSKTLSGIGVDGLDQLKNLNEAVREVTGGFVQMGITQESGISLLVDYMTEQKRTMQLDRFQNKEQAKDQAFHFAEFTRSVSNMSKAFGVNVQELAKAITDFTNISDKGAKEYFNMVESYGANVAREATKASEAMGKISPEFGELGSFIMDVTNRTYDIDSSFGRLYNTSSKFREAIDKSQKVMIDNTLAYDGKIREILKVFGESSIGAQGLLEGGKITAMMGEVDASFMSAAGTAMRLHELLQTYDFAEVQRQLESSFSSNMSNVEETSRRMINAVESTLSQGQQDLLDFTVEMTSGIEKMSSLNDVLWTYNETLASSGSILDAAAEASVKFGTSLKENLTDALIDRINHFHKTGEIFGVSDEKRKDTYVDAFITSAKDAFDTVSSWFSISNIPSTKVMETNKYPMMSQTPQAPYSYVTPPPAPMLSDKEKDSNIPTATNSQVVNETQRIDTRLLKDINNTLTDLKTLTEDQKKIMQSISRSASDKAIQ